MIVNPANIDHFVHVLGTDSAFSELGRAIAQEVNRWLPTPAARIRVREACGICGEQRGNGAGFLRVLRFPLPIIPLISASA
jgi:hypothetical protein